MDRSGWCRGEERGMKRERSDERKRARLYFAMALFVIVVMIRPQVMIPILGIMKPGLISAGLLLVAVITFGKLPYIKDTIVRSFIFYIVVIASTVVVVVNHYHWFWSLFAVVSY